MSRVIMLSGSPLVSVILPVYNGADYLADAVRSILSQTYKNFELIILNDGSIDGSASIVNLFNDPRIRYLEQKNQGLAATLNRGIGLANGKYIARQDQDDISLPRRLEKQVEFMLRHRDCGMVGTWAEIWVGDTRSGRVHQHPADNASLQFFLLFNNPFVHSSVMLRREVFDKVGLYCTNRLRQPPEDYDLWSRVAREFEVANIPEIQLIYREVPQSMSRSGVNPFIERVVNISAENLAWLTDKSATDLSVRDLAALTNGANYLVSPRPSFAELESLLRQAAQLCQVQEDAEIRLRSIRYAYLIFRFGSTLGRVMATLKYSFRKGANR